MTVRFSTRAPNADYLGFVASPEAIVAIEALRRYRGEAGLDNFQMNFHGNRDLGQLLDSMERFMADVAPVVANDG